MKKRLEWCKFTDVNNIGYKTCKHLWVCLWQWGGTLIQLNGSRVSLNCASHSCKLWSIHLWISMWLVREHTNYNNSDNTLSDMNLHLSQHFIFMKLCSFKRTLSLSCSRISFMRCVLIFPYKLIPIINNYTFS